MPAAKHTDPEPALPKDCHWCYKAKRPDGLLLTTPYASNKPNAAGSGYPVPLGYKRIPDGEAAETKQVIRQTFKRADF
tara:strand:- start:3607 stop:3840 length:234 start_codon:yes stop_codon:yes gene_type:complete